MKFIEINLGRLELEWPQGLKPAMPQKRLKRYWSNDLNPRLKHPNRYPPKVNMPHIYLKVEVQAKQANQERILNFLGNY